MKNNYLKVITLVIAFVWLSLPLKAQMQRYKLQAEVRNVQGELLSNATVKIAELERTAVADAKGRLVFANLAPGNYTFLVSQLGYTTLKTKLNIAKDIENHLFTLLPDTLSLKAVAVYGYSATQLANRQAYHVKAIDAKQLHNSTADVAAILDRVSGVRMRQTGGVGSDFSLSLNGFSGNRIRFFLDGVPMENFGPAFQVNNIPINLAERVEVYKGVVPVWLGSDALGGAVNIVTGQGKQNFIDASYSLGSFNTHRSYINAGLTAKNGLTARLSLFQNYSDNNYKVNVDVADLRTGRYTPDTAVRRFHDTYHNETAIAQVGVVNKGWADQFLLGVTLGNYYKEIQNGARLVSVFGGLHSKGNIVTPSIKYSKKDFFVKGLDVILNANYNLGKEQLIDTVNARYGWLGDSIRYGGTGGERSYSNYRYGNNAATAAATLSYVVAGGHHLALNNVYTHFNRKGSDVLFPGSRQYQLPQQMDKNMLGLSYQYTPSEKWTATVFSKFVYQNAYTTLQSNPINNPSTTIYTDVTANRQKLGYGIATSYLLAKQLQAKFSYERTNRLPETDDIYGDLINKQGNWSIKPESSDNLNLGLNYRFAVGKAHAFETAVTGVYSRAKNYIFYTFNTNQTHIVPQNLDGVANLGLEAEIRYSYQKRFTLGANLTLQNIRNKQLYIPGTSVVSDTYNNRIPNIPYLFGNADASVFFGDVVGKGDRLSLGYNLQYVHEFFLFWEGAGSVGSKYTVPMQLGHDANLVYTTVGGKYNIALEARNLSNERLYDNFSLQKPGRALYLKLRYFISK